MSLEVKIQTALKEAMKAKDAAAMRTLRAVKTAITMQKTEKGASEILSKEQEAKILQKMVKQRKDSISQFSDAGRTDLVEVEEAELLIINNYMPKQLSQDEIEAAVVKAISDTGADSMKDMGKLMGILKGQLDGKADMGQVSQLIKSKLS